jgi:hypothetical protein
MFTFALFERYSPQISVLSATKSAARPLQWLPPLRQRYRRMTRMTIRSSQLHRLWRWIPMTRKNDLNSCLRRLHPTRRESTLGRSVLFRGTQRHLKVHRYSGNRPCLCPVHELSRKAQMIVLGASPQAHRLLPLRRRMFSGALVAVCLGPRLRLHRLDHVVDRVLRL